MLKKQKEENGKRREQPGPTGKYGTLSFNDIKMMQRSLDRQLLRKYGTTDLEEITKEG